MTDYMEGYTIGRHHGMYVGKLEGAIEFREFLRGKIEAYALSQAMMDYLDSYPPLSAPVVIIPLPNKHMSGFNAGRAARAAIATGNGACQVMEFEGDAA